MAFKIANKADSTAFSFWHENQVFQGINCQGELFIILRTIPIQRQDQAYALASEVDDAIGSALVVRGKAEYVVCTDLRRKGWEKFLEEDLTPGVME